MLGIESGFQHQSEGERGLAPFQKSRNGVIQGVANNIVPAQDLYKSPKIDPDQQINQVPNRLYDLNLAQSSQGQDL